MRLLLIASDFPNPHDPLQGVFNANLARALARAHEVCVVSPIPWVNACLGRRNKNSPLLDDQKVVNLSLQVHHPIYYYPPKVLREYYGWFFWRSVRRKLWKLVHSFGPDAVLAYWTHPDGEAAVRLAQLTGLPSVVMVGGSDVLVLARDGRRRECITQVLRAAHAVVTVSNDLREAIVELGVPGQKVHVVYRGLDTELFSPGDRVEARRRLGLPGEGRYLLCVGRLVPVKGLDVLLEACKVLRERACDFRLFLVGDGPLRGSLEWECKRRDLSGAVRFVGPVAHEQLPDWYRACDVTVLPSRSEGLPNVLRESVACGTPFVATRVGGIPEFAEGHPHLLVPPANPVALADGVGQALAGKLKPVQKQPVQASWMQSAEKLLSILEPLAQRNWDPDLPWWVDRPAASPSGHAVANSWRKLIWNKVVRALPRRLLTVRGPAGASSVCLTFDDGPHPKHTPRVLKALSDANVRATFFVVGKLAERNPDLVRRIVAEGHALGNHTYHHPQPGVATAGELVQEIRWTNEVLAGVAGVATNLFRPPHGKISAWKLLRLWQAGQTIVLWNVDAKDYTCESAAQLREYFLRQRLQGGDVVLMHDRVPHIAETLPDLIADTRQQGLDFVTANEWAS